MADTLSVRIVGGDRVVARLRSAHPERTLQNVKREVQLLGFALETRVKLDKLMGQVLNRRTGQLSRSINTQFAEPSPGFFVSSTGTKDRVGRLWELTGHRAFDVVPKSKKALFWPGALHPVKRVHIPAEGPRPFLKPTLREMKETIRARLRAAAGLPT